MADVEVPPLSASLDHFRAEVGRRAEVIDRRRRRVVGGSLAGVVLVALAVSVAVITPGSAPPRTAAPSASAPLPSATGTEGGSLSGPAHVYTIDNRASGFTASGVVTGTEVAVELAAPVHGRWGRARVTAGSATVLALSGQRASAAGGVVVTLEARGPGRATVLVPLVGGPAASWTGTVLVDGSG